MRHVTYTREYLGWGVFALMARRVGARGAIQPAPGDRSAGQRLYCVDHTKHTMSIDTLLLFIPACFALNMVPGPNNLLSVSNATRYGFWTSSIAGVGRLIAFVGMIAIAAAGLATVLQTSEILFYAIKIIGAAYLFYLALQLWRASPAAENTEGAGSQQSTFSLARQEFLVAAGNPKAILIFTAFLPQFVDISRKWFSAPRRQQIFNRTCGSLLGAAGIGLLAARRSTGGA